MPSQRTFLIAELVIFGLANFAPILACAQADPVLSAGAAASTSSLAIPGNQSTTGTVERANSTSLTIKDSNGQEREFTMDPAASYTAAMLPGDEVRVYYDPVDGGQDLAKQVQTLNRVSQLDERMGRERMRAASRPLTESPGVREASRGAMTEHRTAAAGQPTTSAVAAAEPGNKEGELPGTASPLPAMALAGILLMGTAIGVRRLARQPQRRS